MFFDMKVNAKELAYEAAIAASALKTGALIPILNNLLLEGEDGKLVITGSDGETTTINNTNISTNGTTFSICVEPKQLLDLLKSLGNTEVSIDIQKDRPIVKITTPNGEFEIPQLPGADYPKPPNFEATSAFPLKGETLAGVIDSALFATSTDELRPVLTGMLIDVHEDKLVFVATDGMRLVKRQFNGKLGVPAIQVIIPPKPLNVVRKSLQDTVMVECSDVNVRFTSGRVTTVARLVDGNYPPYERVIPTENPNKLQVHTSILTESLKRVGLFANKGTSAIVLQMDNDGVNVQSKDVDFSTSAEEKLDASYIGQDLSIAFNSRYALELVGTLPEGHITLSFSGEDKPIIITNETDGYLGLLMPTRL